MQSPGDLQKLQLLLSVLPVMALVLPVVVTCFGASTGSRAPVAGDYPPVPKQNSPTLCRRLESSLSADRHLGVDVSEHRAEAILVKAIQLVQEGGTGCQEIPSMAEVQHTGEVTEPPEDHCLRDDPQWAPDWFQDGWGYERRQCLESPATLPVAECADLQQLDLWADMDDMSAGVCTPLSRPLSNSKAQRSPARSSDRRVQHIKTQAGFKKYRKRKMDEVNPVRPEVFDRLAAWAARVDPDNKEFQLSIDVYGNSRGLQRLVMDGANPRSALNRPWSDKAVWVHSPESLWDQTVTKVIGEGAKGLALLPVRKSKPWFWAFGEIAIDWIDVEVGSPLFINSTGQQLCTTVPYRIVLFDAYGTEPPPESVQNAYKIPHTVPNDADWDAPTDPIPNTPTAQDLCAVNDVESQRSQMNRKQRRILKIRYADDEKPRPTAKKGSLETDELSEASMAEASPGPVSESDTDEPPLKGSAEYSTSQRFTSEGKAKIGYGHREGLFKDSVQVLGSSYGDRSKYTTNVRSVIQADEMWPGAEKYRDALLQRFGSTVFTPKHASHITPAAQEARGEHAIVKLGLIEGAEPRAAKPIRAVGLRETMLQQKLKDFESRGFLREAQANPQWVSRCFLVPKPGSNKWRLVIDYRWLNSQLKGKNFPIPVIEDQLANQSGNFLFTLIDLEDGFHQMHLEEDSKHLTAFGTPFAVFEWNVLPMGVKVGPAAYQEMVQHITKKCPSSRPYIDDILSANGREELVPGKVTVSQKQEPEVLEKYFQKHYEDLFSLFEALERAMLTVKPEKCHFFRKTVKYVGHILKDGRRFPCPSRVEAVANWDHRTITTPKRLKWFLGLVGWYQIYIENFAKHAQPLMEALKGKYRYEAQDPSAPVARDATGLPNKRRRVKLTGKEAKIEWTPEMVENFQILKDKLVKFVDGDGLWLPNPHGKFYSRKLQGQRADGVNFHKNLGQIAWTPREKETYAIVTCLLKFQSWIGGQEVTVQTDHSAIVKWYKEELTTISGPLGRRGRWHEFLSRFNLFIQYRPGKDNEAADALSRWAYPAGEAQDTNFHGSDCDLEGWQAAERAERDRIRQLLHKQYPESFEPLRSSQTFSVNKPTGDERKVERVQIEGWDAPRVERALREVSVSSVHEGMTDEICGIDSDGRQFYAVDEFFMHTCPIPEPGTVALQTPPSEPSVASTQSTAKLSRAERRRIRQMQSKPASRRYMTVSQMYDAFQHMSWHLPGMYNLVQQDSVMGVRDIKTVKIPPAVAVLTRDWSPEYAQDKFFSPHWDKMVSDKFIQIEGKEYTFHEGKVRSRGKICVPTGLLDQVVRATHAFSHPGVRKTREMMDRKYSVRCKGSDLDKCISDVLRRCPVCQSCKPRRGTQPEANQPAPIPEFPFSSICIDFCDLSSDPVVSNGNTYDYVLVVVCRLTGYVVALPCSKTITAEQLAELFLNRVVSFMGLPQQTFSDHDHLVTAKFFTTLCSLSGIDMKQSPIYRPRSNGRAERAVQVVIDSLRKFLEQTRKKNWAQLLPLAVWAANDIPGPIHGYSPHFLLFGRHPIGFGDCPPVIPEHGSEDALKFFADMITNRQYVQRQLQRIHDAQAQRFLADHPTNVYQEGEYVWYSGHDKAKNSKLHRVWTGP